MSCGFGYGPRPAVVRKLLDALLEGLVIDDDGYVGSATEIGMERGRPILPRGITSAEVVDAARVLDDLVYSEGWPIE